jgi:chemotaxis protein MotB
MPGRDNSLYRIFTWLLLASLIGLYVLYDWYAAGLKRQLETRGQEAATTVLRLQQAEARIAQETSAEQDLKTQLQTSGDRLASARAEIESLGAKLKETSDRSEALAAEVEQHKQSLAQAADREQGLVAKLDAAARAHAEVESARDTAQQRATELGAEVERLNKAVGENETRFADEMKALEARLTERAEHLRTALEGSEPERARVISDLERKTEEHRSAHAKAEETLAAAQAEIEQVRKIDESQLQALRAEAEQALAAAKADGEQSLAAAKSAAERILQDTRDGLETQLAQARQSAEETASALKASEEARAQTERDLQVKLDALTADLDNERRTLAELQQTSEQTVGELRNQLALAEQGMEGARKELSEAVRAADESHKTLESKIALLESELATAKLAAEETHKADVQARDQALAEARGLFARYTELGGKQTERGMLLSLSNDELRFPSGAATMPKGKRPGLDRIAGLLKEQPKLSARIEGYTDNSGPDDINQKMSAARAEAVKQALIERGVAAERLTAEGLGEAKPIADNGTPAGRARNRRVEVYVIEEAN